MWESLQTRKSQEAHACPSTPSARNAAWAPPVCMAMGMWPVLPYENKIPTKTSWCFLYNEVNEAWRAHGEQRQRKPLIKIHPKRCGLGEGKVSYQARGGRKEASGTDGHPGALSVHMATSSPQWQSRALMSRSGHWDFLSNTFILNAMLF
jgi:hypothetical protein